MTLREVVEKYGTDIAFSDWLRAVKLIEDINEKHLKNEHTISELVSRQLVSDYLIEPFEVSHKRLITDGAKSIANRVITMSEAGSPVEDCERLIIDQISSHIKRMKYETLKGLRGLDFQHIDRM